MMSNSDARKRAAEKAAEDERAGDVEALADVLAALLREYTAGAYRTLNQNRDAMFRMGQNPDASGSDVICAGLGDWPESFLSTRRGLVDDMLAARDARLIAEAERRGAERALREAAEAAGPALQSEVGGHTSTYSVRRWLRARAAQIGEVRP